VTLLSLYANQRLPLKLAVLFQPFNYILIGLLSCLFLKERLTRRQWLGTLVIIIGVVLYGIGV
jgi:undecaprenyl phosphate-alpha-L-ara4N flippase subunit ArnE